MKKKRVILPVDGFSSFTEIEEKLEKSFSIKGMREIVSHIKLNDVVYSEDGCNIMVFLEDWLKEKGLNDVLVFLDLKLSDTSGTNLNILKQYTDLDLIPDILTIRECCSSTTFKEVRSLLKDTKIALVSVLTDTSEEECKFRYGITPLGKIITDIKGIEYLCPVSVNSVVCSPLEVKKLKGLFPRLEFIVPGIRDEWMETGQQKRATGVRFALENGADFVVMGSQLTKGNPKRGISAEESVLMTIEEIKKFEH